MTTALAWAGFQPCSFAVVCCLSPLPCLNLAVHETTLTHTHANILLNAGHCPHPKDASSSIWPLDGDKDHQSTWLKRWLRRMLWSIFLQINRHLTFLRVLKGIYTHLNDTVKRKTCNIRLETDKNSSFQWQKDIYHCCCRWGGESLYTNILIVLLKTIFRTNLICAFAKWNIIQTFWKLYLPHEMKSSTFLSAFSAFFILLLIHAKSDKRTLELHNF